MYLENKKIPNLYMELIDVLRYNKNGLYHINIEI